MPTIPIFFNKFLKFLKSKWVIGIIALLVLLTGGYFLFFNKKAAYQFVTVENGSIVESVSLTGNTTPMQSVSLAFGSSGIVSGTYSGLGKQVYAGQVLSQLDISDLAAQLQNAKAGLTIALQGASASKTNVANVVNQQDTLVKTAYQNLLNSTIEAVPRDGVQDYTAPVISGNYILGKEGTINLSYYYSSGGISFTISGLASGTGAGNTITAQPIGDSGLYIRSVLNKIETPNWVIEIPNKKAANYLTNYNAYQLALETRDKAVADAKANVGSDDSSQVSDAQIAQAQASIDSIIAKIKNAKIIAPISGVVTQFDAKVGQFASSNTSLISITSNGNYEVDSDISEIDIGKISMGNKVSMTIDAFPGEVFTGSVFYIAPTETNTQSVVSYQVKISFDKPDPRLKSGLTANIEIETKHKDGALILPQYAILQNDKGTFVQILENGKVKDIPVILGIQDQKGNVEILSGVTKGQQVLNIGLKK